MVTKAPLVKRSPDGKTYQCALDSATIPDGCWVTGNWNGTTGAVTGVRAITSGNATVHQCGTTTGLTTKWAGQG